MATLPRMIERRMIFGVRENVKDGIQYLDEERILWVAGNALVLLDTQLGTEELISCSPSCEFVTAMTLTVNHHVLAVAEAGLNPCVVIYLYDAAATPRLRRKKVLQIPDVGSREYVSLCFSQDGKHLVALGGFPEWKIVYWNVERAKVVSTHMAVEDAHIISDRYYLNQCSISPNNDRLLCVSGKKVIRFFQVTEYQLQAHPTTRHFEENAIECLAHTWTTSEACGLIASTTNGDLFLFENMEYKYLLPVSPSDGIPIHALKAFSKGFVCGGDMGLITIFEKTDNKEMYRKVRAFRFALDSDFSKNAVLPHGRQNAPVILAFTLTPPPAEENLAFLTSTKQIYYFNLPNANFTRVDESVFQPVGQPFHMGPIVGVDMSCQRPLIVTAGRDGQIFIWNSITNNVEMRKRFNVEIFSVAMHPSGLHLLVGFADGLKLMNIYAKDLCEFKSIAIRSCTACCFSSGGQFFAAAHSSIIHVYYTYTCELLGHLRGHSGKLRSLHFVPPGDTRLISTGTDGAVYEFSLMDFHKVNDNMTKSITYNCAVADVGTVWAAGNDRKLRQIERSGFQQCIEYDLENASMLSMVISSKMKLLFGGCEDGTVRVFNTYLGEKFFNRESGEPSSNVTIRTNITIETHQAHTGGVSKLAWSYGEDMLVSVGEDGVVVFWDVVAPHQSIHSDVEYSNELLIARNELETTADLITTLRGQLVDLKQRTVQQQIKRQRVHEEQFAKLEMDYREELSRQRDTMSVLESEKNEQAIRFTEYIADLEMKNRNTIEQTEEDYNAKIASLQDRANQLRALLAERRVKYEGRAAEIRREAEARRSDTHGERAKALQDIEEQNHALLLQKKHEDAKTETMSRWIEEENDVELVKSKESYEKRRREQEEELATLQAANNALLKQENFDKAGLEAKRAEVMDRLRRQSVLEGQIDSSKRDIEALTNELRERGDAMEEKDRRMGDLQRKNQELEKFKFVLEYKIKELRAQIEPREAEIRLATEKLAHMEAEAERYQRSNENLVLQIRNLRQKRAGHHKEVETLSTKMKEAEEFQSRLWTQLCDILEQVNNPRRLKEMAKALFNKYAAIATLRATAQSLTSRTAADEVRDYHRERDHLERNLASLRKKVNKDAENNRAEKNRIMSENVILVKEINDLREEACALATKAGIIRPNGPSAAPAYEEMYKRELAMHRAELTRLKEVAEQLEAELQVKGIPLPTSGESVGGGSSQPSS